MEERPHSGSKRRPVVGLYWRKLAFFGFVFSLLLVGASSVEVFRASEYIPSNDSSTLNVELEILENGNVQLDGEQISEKVATSGDRDVLILPLLDQTGIYYGLVHVTATLPANVTTTSNMEIKGIHGVDSTKTEITGRNKVEFFAYEVGPASTLSVIVDMPEGSVNPPFIAKLLAALAEIKRQIWLIIAMALPILTVLFMLAFIRYQNRRQKIDVPAEETDSPPMALPPAIAGVLYHQHVGPRELAATLIDLALRGDIYIIDRERDFAFLKNRFDRRLLSYEKILLSKIFRKEAISNMAEVEQRINNHLYSKKISLVARGIYLLATRLGYFKTNPQKIHRKYQLIGMAAFFGAGLGFALSFLVFDTPSFILFFWAGMMLSGVIITLSAKNIPGRTAIGADALSNWLAFRKYLSNPVKLPFTYESQATFEKYLPYAIVFDCEVAWAKRFSEQNFLLPDWYLSDRSGLGLQEFCLSLFPLVSYVSRSLYGLKEPGTD